MKLTTKELAERWQIHPDTVKEWARKKIIPAIKLVKNWRFDLEKIEKFEQRNSTGVRN